MTTKEIRSILATDCGSTTTKAILIEKQGDTYRLVTRGEAPTTVEAPFEDVTRGVLNAVKEVEELRGRLAGQLAGQDQVHRAAEAHAAHQVADVVAAHAHVVRLDLRDRGPPPGHVATFTASASSASRSECRRPSCFSAASSNACTPSDTRLTPAARNP